MTPMSRDLPGYYYDPVKNRYFPLSHKKRVRERDPPVDVLTFPDEDKVQTRQEKSGSTTKILRLIHQREISRKGQFRTSSSSAQDFQRQYLETHARKPRVWSYTRSGNIADGAIEQLCMSLQTPEGEIETDLIACGGRMGGFTVLKPRRPTSRALHISPRKWNWWTEEEEKKPPDFKYSMKMIFPCSVTSIHSINEWGEADRFQSGNHLQQNVIMTTLGSGLNGGSLMLLTPKRDWASKTTLATITPTNQSVWTSQSCPGGKRASLGMSSGAAIANLERCSKEWICRSYSDVLTQQFLGSGNVLLCGFRNGVISTIDLRQPQPKSYPSHSSDPVICEGPKKKILQGQRRLSKEHRQHSGLEDSLYCSHSTVMQMKSAVCSMELLRSCEFYLLASAMNGDIEQWDRRLVERGPLRSYEGHVNTHTPLQLAVDPTEKLLITGGEDCAIRVWSLASGHLLHVERGFSTPATTVRFNKSFRTSNSTRLDGFSQESPFEEDHTFSVWMGTSGSLLHMYGSAC